MLLPPIVPPEYPPCKCIHCNSERIIRNGRRAGKQRYWCNACKRSFYNDTQNRYYPRVRKHKLFMQYLSLCRKPLTVRACADILGVSPATVYRWRRIYLQVLSNTSAKQISPSPQVNMTFTPIYTECLPSLIERLQQPHPPGWRNYPCTRLPIIPDRRSDSLYANIAHLNIGTDHYSFIVPKGWGQPVAETVWAELSKDESENNSHVNIQPASSCELISLLFVHWLKSFRGVHTNYLHLYISWFNECWYDIAKYYGFYIAS